MIDKPVMLITGTRKGIGRYLAEYYAMKEFQIVGCSRQDIDFEFDNYLHFIVDITNEDSVKNLFKNIREKFGRLDILINNAGVNYALSPLLLVSYESAVITVKVNLLGTFLMSREATKLMMKNSYGRIINFGSMAVRHKVKGEAIYTASKAAINAFTKVMAKEVFSYGINCNVISPSAIKTDMVKNINKKSLNKILDLNAIPSLGKLEDVSSTIDWLIEPKNNAITGQIIYLGGV